MRFQEAQVALAAAGRELYERGWVPATSGNFSLRTTDAAIAITASGRHKGRLGPEDILQMNLAGTIESPQKPSAETGLHLQLYRRAPAVGAVLHTHSVAATFASMAATAPTVNFSGLEMLKAFEGFTTHEATLEVPVFANDQDIPRLAQQVDEYMNANGMGAAYLIRGHGLYTWARDLDGCLRHLEALEYLFDYQRLCAGATQRVSG
ncbi:MAG: methylthioribulose 1-phosphate dehydratase [Pseudomonadota bacterium]